MNSPELKENPVAIEFHGDYNIIYIGSSGNYGIVRREDSESDIVDNLRKAKEGEIRQKINLMTIREAENFIEYKTVIKYLEKDLWDIFEKLNPRYRSLIGLSIYIKQCYDEGRKEEAESMKASVRERYGDPGLKFVNLWSRSYLKSLFKFLSQNPMLPLDINTRIFEFIEKAESIFFIHPEADYKEVIKEVEGLLERGEDYVAIHSRGLAGPKALEIMVKVKCLKTYNYQEVQICKKRERAIEVSKIWYKGEGVKTYLLIKDTIA